MDTSNAIVALADALAKQGYSFAANVSSEDFRGFWDLLSSRTQKVGKFVTGMLDLFDLFDADGLNISYDSVDKEAFARDLAKISALRDDMLISWAYQAGTLCVNVILPVGKAQDSDLVDFFERFDDLVVKDMRKHVGRGHMDTKLGTYGTVFFVFPDSHGARHFEERSLKKCYGSHFLKETYCSSIIIDSSTGNVVQGRAVFGAKWTAGLKMNEIREALNKAAEKSV